MHKYLRFMILFTKRCVSQYLPATTEYQNETPVGRVTPIPIGLEGHFHCFDVPIKHEAFFSNPCGLHWPNGRRLHCERRVQWNAPGLRLPQQSRPDLHPLCQCWSIETECEHVWAASSYMVARARVCTRVAASVKNKINSYEQHGSWWPSHTLM